MNMLISPRCLSWFVVLGLAGVLAAQNCAGTGIGATPLVDLGVGLYQGFPGGLYPGGGNVPPPAHFALGQSAMATVVPRDQAGNPAANGRIVVLSIGMSNTTQEFSTWQAIANADPNRNPAVLVVDGAQGGQDAVTIANPLANFWTVVDQRLAAAGASAPQVQVVWLKEAIAGVSGGFPAGAQQLQGLLGQIAGILKVRYPHVALCFCSSRTYAGYATSPLNPEPYAYESGFAVKWLCEQQIAGDPQLNSDPTRGPVLAPWLGLGPYLWTDGTTARSDGLVWTCADVQPDGTHPSVAGRTKVANLLQQFFTTNPLSAPWYVAVGLPTATFTLYGTGCPGSLGVPRMRNNGLPRLGNATFRLGVESCPPGAVVALWLSLAPGNVPIAGPCVLQIDPAQAFPGLFGVSSAVGTRQEPLPIPSDPSYAGLQLYGQWAVLDALGAPAPGLPGLSGTAACRLGIGL